MQITITSTPNLTTIDGVPVRLWEGVTERGVKCKVFVHRVAVHESEDSRQFDEELKAMAAPGADLRGANLRGVNLSEAKALDAASWDGAVSSLWRSH